MEQTNNESVVTAPQVVEDVRYKVKAFRLNETASVAVVGKYGDESPQAMLIHLLRRTEVPIDALAKLFNLEERLLTRYLYGTSIPSEQDKDTLYRKIPLILNEALRLELLPCSDKRVIIPALQVSVRLILQAKRIETLTPQ